MNTIQFTRNDLDLFSSASHDRNPLHLSDEYSRRTPYGGRVVFGVLDGLTASGFLADRAGVVLSSLEFEFFDTALLGIDYAVEVNENDASETTVRVMDGRRPVLEAVLTFRPGTPRAANSTDSQPSLSEPKDLSPADLPVGHRVSGRYGPSARALTTLISNTRLKQAWITPAHIAALLWASYLVGMELPGKRALFSRLSIEFDDINKAAMPFDYDAEIVDISDVGEITIEAKLISNGVAWAKATMAVHVREDLPAVTLESVEKLAGRSQALTGKVALVTGASRGLGASLVRALALHGCTVLLNFVRSQDQAQELHDSLAQAPGKVVLEAGDASDFGWCEKAHKVVLAQFGRLDFLVCNASPPLLPLWLERAAANRVNDFIAKSVNLVSAPMMSFLPTLAATRGWNVLISSTAVLQPHPHFPHYVVAKSAAEAMVRAASAEYRTVSSLVVRPSRLLTDLTNTPLGRRGALPPECVAVAIMKRLEGSACPGKVEILDPF